MRITTVHGRDRGTPVQVYRPHTDPHSPHYGDRRRHLVISAPYGMPTTAILAEIADELDDAELIEVAEAFGLEREQAHRA